MINIIIGPPCSGKTTYAQDNRAAWSPVVDLDDLALALGSERQHAAEGAVKDLAHVARTAVIDAILYGIESDVFIIHTNPSAEQIETYSNAGALFLMLDPGLETCIERAEADNRPEGTEKVIRDWYDNPPTIPTDSTESNTMNRNKLQQLFSQNQNQLSPKPRINNETSEATIYLYDAIGGYWGIEAAPFVQGLASLDVNTIHLRINSPGGDVFDARAIATALSQHPAKVIAHIDGLAASAATYIATSADEVEIADGAFFMIHKGWTMQIGNADEMRTTADLLDQVDGSISADYQKKTGIDSNQIETWMAAETWFTADQAVTHGFADRKYDSTEPVENRAFNLAAYDNVPDAVLNPPDFSPPQSPEQSAPDRAKMLRRLALIDRLENP